MATFLSFFFFASCVFGHFFASSSSFTWRKTALNGVSMAHENAVMNSGNLLITQPNEVFTHRFLIEVTPKGEFVQSFELAINAKSFVQPIDLTFHPTTQTLYVLDFLKGVFVINSNGTVAGNFGEAVGNGTALGCSLEAITWDRSGEFLYVLDIDTTCQGYPLRIPGVRKFDVTGKYLGIVITAPLILQPDGFALDQDGNFWFTDQQVIKKFGPDGKLIGNYSYPQVNARIYNRVKSIGSGSSQSVFITSITPDTLVVVDSNGKYISQMPMQGDVNAESGTPSGLAIETSSGNLFIESADSEGRGTQRIQVYSKDGTYLYGFGGTECGDSGANYLCQTFDGMEFVP